MKHVDHGKHYDTLGKSVYTTLRANSCTLEYYTHSRFYWKTSFFLLQNNTYLPYLQLKHLKSVTLYATNYKITHEQDMLHRAHYAR